MAQQATNEPRTSSSAPEEMATSFGFSKVPEGQKQELVDDVFHKVADRYDLMNDLMSGGLHRVWKDAMVSTLAPPKSASRGWRLLDVAGGTGDISTRVVRRSNSTAQAIVCDINESMLRVGRDRAKKAGLSDLITFSQGNAEDLPFPDRSFDAYTIAFGIRNVPDIPKALREANRVLKRGGRFLCLEFSEVDVPWLDRVYDAFSFKVIPAIGRLATGDSDPYQYLVESIRKFPQQDQFVRMIETAGFDRVSFRNYSGGIAASHSGWKF